MFWRNQGLQVAQSNAPMRSPTPDAPAASTVPAKVKTQRKAVLEWRRQVTHFKLESIWPKRTQGDIRATLSACLWNIRWVGAGFAGQRKPSAAVASSWPAPKGSKSGWRSSSAFGSPKPSPWYCAKNDTIGFFGPLAWGRIADDGPALRSRAGSLVRERAVHLEAWPVQALAEALDPQLKIAAGPFAEHDLRIALEQHPDGGVRERGLAALDRLEAARDAVASSRARAPAGSAG